MSVNLPNFHTKQNSSNSSLCWSSLV